MAGRSSMYGRRVRTQQDHYQDALAFIYNARPAPLLAMTAERLCDDKGVKTARLRADIASRLAEMQARERAA